MITYTFPTEFSPREFAGQTVAGGRIDQMMIGSTMEPVVRFATRIAGKSVIAKIAGKPELEAIHAEHCAAQARTAQILEALGWPVYRKIQAAAINAHAAYESASEHGYPVREAAKAKAADEALATARHEYPGAAAYALAESFSFAMHEGKAAAGRTAMAAIEQGDDFAQAIAEMQAAWSAAAAKAVDHA